MKRSILLFSVLAVLAGCNSNKKDTSSTSTAKEEKPADPGVDKGLDLVAKSGCFTCHKVDQQFNGPAYTAIAARYPKNEQVLDSLSQKIIKGGVGNWGTIPMQPNPQISADDAKLMVEYILSLKQ